MFTGERLKRAAQPSAIASEEGWRLRQLKIQVEDSVKGSVRGQALATTARTIGL
jgi:hypothetical protein